jgi:hypothetical protein
MSASLDSVDSALWNYRVQDKRLVVVKTKNEGVRKVAVLDVLSNLTFAVEVPAEIAFDSLKADSEYLATFKVYTSKDLKGVEGEFISFFEELDVDQATEDFIKAYWIYPAKIRFQLVEIEEP